MSSRRKQKNEVLAMLEKQSLQETHSFLSTLAAKDVVNILFSAICRDDPFIKWHAVRCMGRAVARVAADDFEQGRIIMRRFLWSLNDESGGIGWGAPESMAESMCCCHQIGEEYHHMLISYMRGDGPELHQDGNFLEHPLLQRGLLWAIGRLASLKPELIKDKIVPGDLLFYLNSTDVEVQGLAIRAAGFLNMTELQDTIFQLKYADKSFMLYDDQFKSVTLAQLVDDFILTTRS